MIRILLSFLCLCCLASESDGQSRLHFDSILGYSTPTSESGFRDWAGGPKVGLGAAYDLMLNESPNPSILIFSRVSYHHISQGGKFPQVAWPRQSLASTPQVEGESLRAFEYSAGVEFAPVDFQSLIAVPISFSVGGAFLRSGEIDIDDQTIIDARSQHHIFVAPGLGIRANLWNVSFTLEGQVQIVGDGAMLFRSLQTSVRI